ncbi:hypothetical protein ABT282_08370 [Streptomyces sp. NPDC000927]|uniref:phage baseplate protein n=1 Tax=Streptomyces sp. NPDC000927 TaxID=3154371 RepID=UPI0033301405
MTENACTIPPFPTKINLERPHSTTLTAIRTSQNTVIQGFAVDPTNDCIYTSQLINGNTQLPGEKAPVPYATRASSGDIAITKISLTNHTVLGVMYIKGAGHGMTIQVEHAPDGVWLWVDADSSSGGFARAIGRTRFQNGAVLNSRTQTTVIRPFGTDSHGLSAAVDQHSDQIMVRRGLSGNNRRYYLYNLTAFKAGVYTPIATVDQAVGSATPDGMTIGTFQGAATWGNYLYSLEGTATNGGTNTTYLTCLHWHTGQLVQRALVTHELGLEYREPEGMDVWTPDPLNPMAVRLGYGFAGGPSGKRHFTLCMIDSNLAA